MCPAWVFFGILSVAVGSRHSFHEITIGDNLPRCSNIDLVYTWVNGSAGHHAPIQKLDTLNAEGIHRFRNMDELYYSLRGVERYMPYIRRVFIVTNGERISWLKSSEWKVPIEYVYHKTIIPPSDHISRNSLAIESFLHRIPGLSEFYVYLNDDCLITNYIDPKLLFDGPVVPNRNGCYVLDPHGSYRSIFPVERRNAPGIQQYGQYKRKCGHYFAIQNSNLLVNVMLGSDVTRQYPKHSFVTFRRSVMESLEIVLKRNAKDPVRTKRSISVINTEGYLAANNYFPGWYKQLDFDSGGLFAYVPLKNNQSLSVLRNELDRRPLTLCINDILDRAFEDNTVLVPFISTLHKILNDFFQTDSPHVR